MGCNAFDRNDDHFLAYCKSANHGHYDHAAFFFNLENGLKDNVKKANILFLGDSRIQIAFSTKALIDYESANPDSRPYLLGFGYIEQDVFAENLLRRLRPRPKVMVINVDPFFSHQASPHALRLLNAPLVEERNARIKKIWHYVSLMSCEGKFFRPLNGVLCGSQTTVYRSIRDGRWVFQDVIPGKSYVEYFPETTGDAEKIATYTANAIDFLRLLPVDRSCIVITQVPWSHTQEHIAKSISDNLGVTFMSPHLSNLMTFDGSHLDTASAERWSREFLVQLKLVVNRCL